MSSDHHHRVDYLEIPTPDPAASKAFCQRLFGWEFTDYGPDYTSFQDGRMAGGFHRAEQAASLDAGSVLLVVYSTDLEGDMSRVIEAGGTITKAIFSFPGGRRFHYRDPAGVEMALWSE